MAYNYTEQELYDRALFNFQKGDQQINVAFEHDGDEVDYMMIVWSECGKDILDKEDSDFCETIDEILEKFDSDKDLKYNAIIL